MARQVLENGVILPAEYSDDWYDDMTSNLTKLDDVIGSDSEKLSSSDVGAAALSNNYNDLDNLPTIPTVNDATLTIQKNGVDVQTFTANASSNVTCNITVPTKTSDLTNDSNFVDTSNAAVSSGITSAKVTDYDAHIADTDIHVTTADKNRGNNQTYVFRYSSTALKASSTNSNALLDNTDNLKVGDKVIDSSGVLFSITAIDTANSTFTIGTALIDLARDSDVVHRSGNETISGEKNFQNTATNYSGIKLEGTRVCHITADNANDGVFTSNICSFSFLLPDGNKAVHVGRWTSSNNRIFLDKSYPYMSFNGVILKSNTYVPTGETNTATLRLMSQLNYADDTNKSVDIRLIQYDSAYSALYSNTDNVTSLGVATKRWSKIYGTEYYYGSNSVEFSTKFVTTDTAQTISGNKTFSSINGVEPSSLSLPSGNANDVIDISSYITALDGTSNSYTVPANGWISIAIVGTAIAIISSSWSDSRLRASSGNVRMLYPVLKNETLDITVIGTTLAYARFIPCQGNI